MMSSSYCNNEKRLYQGIVCTVHMFLLPMTFTTNLFQECLVSHNSRKIVLCTSICILFLKVFLFTQTSRQRPSTQAPINSRGLNFSQTSHYPSRTLSHPISSLAASVSTQISKGFEQFFQPPSSSSSKRCLPVANHPVLHSKRQPKVDLRTPPARIRHFQKNKSSWIPHNCNKVL